MKFYTTLVQKDAKLLPRPKTNISQQQQICCFIKCQADLILIQYVQGDRQISQEPRVQLITSQAELRSSQLRSSSCSNKFDFTRKHIPLKFVLSIL